MKRFHVHLSVRDLSQSIRFYSSLFGAEPAPAKAEAAACCTPSIETAGVCCA